MVASFLDDRAAFGKARAGLDAIAASGSALADDARWLSARLQPDPRPAAWPGARVFSYDVPPSASGLVTGLAVLGPFRDTGGGLDRKERPEAPGESFTDIRAQYSWGVYEVAWRKALPASVTARGVPLDLYIHPRSESCTYVASKVTFPAGTKKALLFGAASGTVRLIWDNRTITKSDDVHTKLVLDRIGAEIDVTPGPHLVAAKVCSTAVNDDGRVRLRFTDENRKPFTVTTSSDLRGLALPANEDPKPAFEPAKASPAKGGAPAKGGGKPVTPPGGPGSKLTDKPKAQFAGGGKPVDKAPITPPTGKGGKPAATGSKEPPPPAARPIKTSLEKALELPDDDASSMRTLAAAVLRVIAYADNATSPRAPGLLDRVTRDDRITADALAMAGWVATSGANRAGGSTSRTRAASPRRTAPPPPSRSGASRPGTSPDRRPSGASPRSRTSR
ncbi:MAG: hypothetical protein IPM79_26155 [Polyangiaceae bacterium]|nr:hypothetical protein [Polyangiaceae bacterium]